MKDKMPYFTMQFAAYCMPQIVFATSCMCVIGSQACAKYSASKSFLHGQLSTLTLVSPEKDTTSSTKKLLGLSGIVSCVL